MQPCCEADGIGTGHYAAKPWLALRDRGTFIGDPFEPIVSESEIESPK